MFISNQASLKKLVSVLQKSKIISVDTEFMWRDTYYPIFCLLQISTDKNKVYLIDACNKKLDLRILKPVFESNDIIKIFHASDIDLKIIYENLNIKINNLFDTQKACEYLKINTQISLSNLLKHFNIVEIKKTETMSNWLKRPLSSKQLNYAREDVIYLHLCYEKIMELFKKDELKYIFFQKEMKYLTNNEIEYNFYKNYKFLFKKLTKLETLKMKNLLELRENIAKKSNCLSRKVFSNRSCQSLVHSKLKNVYKIFKEMSLRTPERKKIYPNIYTDIYNVIKKSIVEFEEINKNNTEIKQKINIEEIDKISELKDLFYKYYFEYCDEVNIYPQTVINKCKFFNIIKIANLEKALEILNNDGDFKEICVYLDKDILESLSSWKIEFLNNFLQNKILKK